MGIGLHERFRTGVNAHDLGEIDRGVFAGEYRIGRRDSHSADGLGPPRNQDSSTPVIFVPPKGWPCSFFASCSIVAVDTSPTALYFSS